MAYPITGLASLGRAIEGATADYVGRKRQLEDEERRRAERLQDIQSQRGYENEMLEKQHVMALADDLRRRADNLTDEQKRAALANRQRALQEALARGLLTAQQIGDQQAEDAALLELGTQMKKEAAFSQEQPLNARAALDQLVQQERELQSKIAEEEARQSQQPTIDPAVVTRRAIETATQKNGGKKPSLQQIEDEKPAAIEEAKEMAMTKWYQDYRDSQVRVGLFNNQLTNIRQQKATLEGTFRVAPSPLTTAPAPVPQTSTAPLTVPKSASLLSGFQAEMDRLLRERGFGVDAPNPNANPLVLAATAAKTPQEQAMLRQANTSRIAQGYADIEEPIMAKQQDLEEIQRRKALVLQGINPDNRIARGGYEVQTPRLSADQQSQMLTGLLIAESNLNTDLQKSKQDAVQRKRALLQPVQFNQPAQSVVAQPNLVPAAPSPGLLLSTPAWGPSESP